MLSDKCAYVVDYSELCIMLALEGIEDMYGLFFEKDISSKNMLNLLNSMVNKGMVDNDGKRFIICEPYVEMLRVFKSYERYIYVGTNNMGSSKYFYLGESIVEMYHPANRNGKLCINMTEKLSVEDMIDFGQMPESIGKEMTEEWHVRPDNREVNRFDMLTNMESIIRQESVLVLCELRTRQNELLKRAVVYSGNYYNIWSSDYKEPKVITYTVSAFKNIIKGMLEV